MSQITSPDRPGQIGATAEETRAEAPRLLILLKSLGHMKAENGKGLQVDMSTFLWQP